jgi:hypothetical protein
MAAVGLQDEQLGQPVNEVIVDQPRRAAADEAEAERKPAEWRIDVAAGVTGAGDDDRASVTGNRRSRDNHASGFSGTIFPKIIDMNASDDD